MRRQLRYGGPGLELDCLSMCIAQFPEERTFILGPVIVILSPCSTTTSIRQKSREHLPIATLSAY